MSGSPRVCGLLALLVVGSQPGNAIIQQNANDNGCNGVPGGIPCCEDGFAVGDNEGWEERFIQAYEYISTCAHTCKVLHKDSVGITESVRQQYSSGQGKNKNKCWCEFWEPKLNSNHQEYRTCLFTSMSVESLSSDEEVSSKAHETPEFLLVSSKGEATSRQREKMGLYKKLRSEFHNNFPVWKNEKKEQYVFMSENHHWGIGPDYNTDLFGILNYEDRPTPALPHLGHDWVYWYGQEWREDDLIKVLEGDREDAGIDREMIFLDHSPFIIENVADASHCCQACKDQADPHRMQDFQYDHTKAFNYNKGAKTCDCMNLFDSWRQLETAIFTRYNPNFTSGICDTTDVTELTRRTGLSDNKKVWASGRVGKRYYNKDIYNYTDVQGALGEGREFYYGNLLTQQYGHHIFIDDPLVEPLDHNYCCERCQKRNPKIQVAYHDSIAAASINCHCDEVKPGTRPVTIPAPGSFAGICHTTTTPNHVELADNSQEPWQTYQNQTLSAGNVYVVNSQGKLGAICARPGLSEAAARVICRQLGFTGDDVVAYEGPHFGPVSDDFAMSEVECSGYEDRIQDCASNEEVVNCTWADGANIKCN